MALLCHEYLCRKSTCKISTAPYRPTKSDRFDIRLVTGLFNRQCDATFRQQREEFCDVFVPKLHFNFSLMLDCSCSTDINR